MAEKDEVIWREQGLVWWPHVKLQEGTLFLEVPVASGFADFSDDFPITQLDFEVIKSNHNRLIGLYAALIPRCQMRQLGDEVFSDEDARQYFDNILHSTEGDFTAYIDKLVKERPISGIKYSVDTLHSYYAERDQA